MNTEVSLNSDIISIFHEKDVLTDPRIKDMAIGVVVIIIIIIYIFIHV